MGIGAGAFCLFFTDEAVKYVQRVEEEMRIDLMLQLDVSVLSHVRLLSFLLHLASCVESIIDHEHYAVYCDLSKDGCGVKDREFMDEFIVVKGSSKTRNDRFKQCCSDSESYEDQYLVYGLGGIVVFTCKAYVEHVYTYEDDEREGI